MPSPCDQTVTAARFKLHAASKVFQIDFLLVTIFCSSFVYALFPKSPLDRACLCCMRNKNGFTSIGI